jgi:hypothetical protein
VFICYKRYSADTLAERLRSALKDYGISAFVDTFDIPKEYELTEKWWQERDSAIINSRTFVMIVTIGFERSPQIVDEIKLAERHNRQFMCFRWANLRPEILIDLGDHKLNLKDIEQTEFGAADELVRRFFDFYGKGHSIEPKKVTVLATKRMPTLASRNLLPLVHYEITQSIQNTEYKRKLPDVGFYIRSWHGYPIRARVKARVILGDKDLGMEKGEYRNGKYMGYYNGRTPWNLNPYAIVFGHFSIPQECVQGVQSEETLTIEVRVSLKDQNGQTFEYLPVAFTYIPKSNSWFFEPRSF